MPRRFTLFLIAALCLVTVPGQAKAAEQQPVEYGPAGSVGIPERMWYDHVFSPEKYEDLGFGRDQLAADEREMLVFSEEDTAQSVKAEIQATRPIALQPYRVRIPEWLKEVDFSQELKFARDLAEAVESDRYAELFKVCAEHFPRFGTRAEDIRSHTNVELRFSNLRRTLSSGIEVSVGQDLPEYQVKAYFGLCRNDKLVPGISHLRIMEREDDPREIRIDFYANGVPFILDCWNSEGRAGWQIRWLPNGKLARAIQHEGSWTPFTANGRAPEPGETEEASEEVELEPYVSFAHGFSMLPGWDEFTKWGESARGSNSRGDGACEEDQWVRRFQEAARRNRFDPAG